VLAKHELAAPAVLNDIPFICILERRRSIAPSREASRDDLAALLWHGARVRETGTGRFGPSWQHRAAPSSGGIHPIHLFVRNRCSDDIKLYDPLRHALLSIATTNRGSLLVLDEQVNAAAPRAIGTTLLLIANASETAAAYENADSLVWRDAGAFMMALQLVAEYLELAFCPVGVLGTALIDALALPAGWVAAGTCVVGARSAD
jgi:SagB-type dehydrogenase family enzyme